MPISVLLPDTITLAVAQVHDALFLAGDRSLAAVFGPQNEYWYMSRASFVGYGPRTPCLKFDRPCTDPMTEPASTSRFDKLAFDNSSVRTGFGAPYKQILYDLDGTLTGVAKGSVAWSFKFNIYPGMSPLPYNSGFFLDVSFRVRGIDSVASCAFPFK